MLNAKIIMNVPAHLTLTSHDAYDMNQSGPKV